MRYFVRKKWVYLISMMVVIVVAPLAVTGQGTTIKVDTPKPATEWALLQRELLHRMSNACEHYFDRYFDEKGFLLADERWGGNDGPDDAIENVNRWPELHALGGSDRVMELYQKAYDGHVRQYTYTDASEHSFIPYIRDGMYYKEFHTKMDWVHNSEGITVFNVMGLGDPNDPIFENRVRRFAEFYMDEDPGALNYDPEHKIIRSMFNGSRGPLLRKTTSVDWAGDPDEIRNRYSAGHGETHYEEFLFHFKDYHDIVGDHPQNLLATTLAYNAYILTGENKYRDWILEYVDAWYNRMKANNWIIPSNIGLDGTIGGESGGKWYGGTYGWSFTIESQTPGNGMDTRNTVYRGFVGFMNAYMLTRDSRYLEAWRKQDEVIYNAGKNINGVYHTPRSYGNRNWSREGYTEDDGWYDFRPGRSQNNKLELYYLSWKPEDRKLIESNSWLDFLEGNNPDYAVNAFRKALEDVQERMRMMREDETTPDTRLTDDPMSIDPASNANMTPLIHLMGGGIYMPTLSTVFHTRLRYFDPERDRAGVPEDMAALVDRMTDQSVRVKLINLNLVEERTLVVQGGGYGEHQIVAVTYNGERTPVDNPSFRVELEPGTGATLEIEMRRYVNQPVMDFPWDH